MLIMEARNSYILAPAPLPAINPSLTNEKSNTTNKWHVELQHEWSPISYGLVPCGSLALMVKVWKSCGFSYSWILKRAGMQILRYRKNCALLLQLFLQTQTFRIWSQSLSFIFLQNEWKHNNLWDQSAFVSFLPKSDCEFQSCLGSTHGYVWSVLRHCLTAEQTMAETALYFPQLLFVKS